MKQNKNLEEKGWPALFSRYKMSKICISHELSDKVTINCVYPGYVKTGIAVGTRYFLPSEGAKSIVKLALSPPTSPNSQVF